MSGRSSAGIISSAAISGRSSAGLTSFACISGRSSVGEGDRGSVGISGRSSINEGDRSSVGAGGVGGGDGEQTTRAAFQLMDTSGNGKLSRAEVIKAARTDPQTRGVGEV